MSDYTCKMCAGALTIDENERICTCKYCGTTQTVPNLTDSKRALLFERATHLRQAGEYDKAIAVVDEILNNNIKDSESYWFRVLCKYGIEYVEDAKTNKRVPTINRMQYGSVLADMDYRAAITNSSLEQVDIYQREAESIDYIQKNILKIVKKEEPFDVFICYKRTDENGNRTLDSVLANDLYHQLVVENLKVFFAEITLENKLGKDYEPYIFSALNSAKVMLVLGTKPEYFNAVWVKNEWSRFISIMSEKTDRVLIPCYKDMEAIELPEEFAHLQIQDMNRIGFVSDIIRGIKKVLNKTTAPKLTPADLQQTVYIKPVPEEMINRIKMAIEYQEWGRASKLIDTAKFYIPHSVELSFYENLCENRYSELAQYEEALHYQLQNILPVPKANTVSFSDISEEFCNKYYIENYLSKKEIVERLNVFAAPKTVVPSIQKVYDDFHQKEWVRLYEENSQNVPEVIATLFNNFEAEYSEALNNAKAKDSELYDKWKKEFDIKYNSINQEIAAKYDEANRKRDEDILRVEKELKTAFSHGTLTNLKSRLANIGLDYKNADKLYKKCDKRAHGLKFAKTLLTAVVVLGIIMLVYVFVRTQL